MALGLTRMAEGQLCCNGDSCQRWTKLTNFSSALILGFMKTITTHEAKTHLSRYLAEVEEGEEFIIARGKHAVARLVPMTEPEQKPRPKVGEIEGEPFEFPASAFAPLTEDELKEWGL
jgi:antitoxin (DNA-binding transcriptional repressor) of toxin-antitoxin stability system